MSGFDHNLAPLEGRLRNARRAEKFMKPIEKDVLAEAVACLEQYQENPSIQLLVDMNQWLLWIGH